MTNQKEVLVQVLDAKGILLEDKVCPLKKYMPGNPSYFVCNHPNGGDSLKCTSTYEFQGDCPLLKNSVTIKYDGKYNDSKK